jgi:peptide/nickel transport system permease protein
MNSNGVNRNRTRNLQLYTGAGILLALSIPAVFILIFGNVSVELDMSRRLVPSGSAHWLGTDDLGRDLVSCIIHGSWISLGIGLTVTIISVVIGGSLGMAAGFTGGIIDTVIMRIVDILMAFPGMLLAIALAAFFGHGVFNLMLVLTVTGWVEYTRLIRGEVLKIKQKEFIQAAKSYNASSFHILYRHIMPLILPLLIVRASLGIAGIIIVESGLNFLGIGLAPETPSLGQLVDAGRDHLFDAPTLILAPGLVLFLIILAFNFIGEGLRCKTRG